MCGRRHFLLGAAAVGVIGLVRELVIERRRESQVLQAEQRRWKREDTARNRTVRSARRLVGDELDTLGNHLAMMLRHDCWPAADVVDRAQYLAQTEWTENKRMLAEALDDDNTWDVLASFYYSTGQLRARALSGHAGAKLTVKDRENLQLMQDQAYVLKAVVENDVALPDDWRAQLEAVRSAGKDVGATAPPNGV